MSATDERVHRASAVLGVTPDALLAMPPDDLRKLLAYQGHNTHWTERLEYLLSQLVYYTVNAHRGADTPPISMDKFLAPLTRSEAGAPDGGGGGSRQTAAQAERAARGYG